MARTIIVGIGNPILGDDGVGLHVVRQLKGRTDVDIREAYTGGLNLLDMILGYDRAVLVDAIYLEEMRFGEIRVMELDEFASVHSTNPHDTTLMDAVEMSRRLGEDRIPLEITLVGIRIESVDEFSDELSEKVKEAIPEAVDIVKGLLGS
ncbi:MAG: hydrogenase maturation protease [Candidatus Thermoplasmatota archaeon]|nr:hydrogenase maturation protease [Candidatus Thermoplasmatota archaeon]